MPTLQKTHIRCGALRTHPTICLHCGTGILPVSHLACIPSCDAIKYLNSSAFICVHLQLKIRLFIANIVVIHIIYIWRMVGNANPTKNSYTLRCVANAPYNLPSLWHRHLACVPSCLHPILRCNKIF